MDSTVYYFPPDITKIGDNLLTWDIAHEASRAHARLIYVSTPTVAGVLERFGIDNIEFRHVASEPASFRLARSLRPRGGVIDLQQLNAWLDWPAYRHLFDTPIHPRATREWDDPDSVRRWGSAHFAEIFRDMLDLPDQGRSRPALRTTGTPGARLLLFPHAMTGSQQLGCWRDVAALASTRAPTAVVGLSAVREQAAWPPGVDVLTDLAGGELVDLIASARACIGGSTGLSHVAAELGRPVLFVWGCDTSTTFRPVRTATARHLLAGQLTDDQLLAAIGAFIDAEMAPAH
ncbi:glycosyltransferase family 9 protein [Burkholderia alba]|uniref:glycosyltransferase family 9 protein n=1 Tax=Burkholderia alba TaxID=2683677 RepID=UPI002B055A09|nr:glycosyltransferase family 9 protein [Burkholderia alba]